ncbi:hypothetical protein BT67DRAFT_131934 [Trichocladium antarcticum]|uniref:Uncharacterized protein n=1 Tax=Trichocladium antarcticum TaxID=1450529 RepID=A0AAN6ZHW4_9PEZI|nr:hypothetical protein BT67DRAFT_131934 [Trichocladium antarcticum]
MSEPVPPAQDLTTSRPHVSFRLSNLSPPLRRVLQKSSGTSVVAGTVVLQLCVPCFRLFHDVRSQPALPLEATRRGPGNSGSGPIQRREASRPDFFNLSNDASISRRRRCTFHFYHRRHPAHTSYGPVSTPAMPICSENTIVPSA